MKYETISHDVEDYNPTARRIRFETPVKLDEFEYVEEAVLVMSEGHFHNNWALFIKDEYFIEGYTEESVMWRLAEVSENLEVQVTEK